MLHVPVQATYIFGPIIFIVAVMVIRTDKKIIRALRRAGAVHPGCTIELDTSGTINGWRIRRFMRFGVLVEIQPGRFYLDEERYLELRKKKVMIMLSVVSAALIAVVLFLRQS